MSLDDVAMVLARRAVVSTQQARSVLGQDLDAGDVLATGVVLQVDRDEINGEVRLEMPGSDIHYVGFDEPVLVLASVTRELLDGISMGTFVARAHPPRLTAVPEPSPTRPEGKRNRGPKGMYDEGVRHYTDVCPIHGETMFAIHRAGRAKDGHQRFNGRCLECHADYNLDSMRRKQ